MRMWMRMPRKPENVLNAAASIGPEHSTRGAHATECERRLEYCRAMWRRGPVWVRVWGGGGVLGAYLWSVRLSFAHASSASNAIFLFVCVGAPTHTHVLHVTHVCFMLPVCVVCGGGQRYMQMGCACNIVGPGIDGHQRHIHTSRLTTHTSVQPEERGREYLHLFQPPRADRWITATLEMAETWLKSNMLSVAGGWGAEETSSPVVRGSKPVPIIKPCLYH
jgi:hypothetical protein